jgi:GTPase Era involved in 16S rRNA processing
LTLNLEEIQQVSDEMEQESRALRKDLYKMSWYMRGGLTIDQAYMLDQDERSIIADIIKENLETTKETNMPFF